ncbi:hypothetical protein BSPWISOXPB_340 [uncultured Gammaproteobacteria bacterium]|nr:hypothetical protein BSPWISOXPB_340 [uncultured Gammaproteobacteria bacterium]
MVIGNKPSPFTPNNNRGTENNNQNNFDANGNLLNLNNIGSLEWHYNNTLNKLTKATNPTPHNTMFMIIKASEFALY